MDKHHREGRVDALRERLTSMYEEWLTGRISRMHAFQNHPSLMSKPGGRVVNSGIEDRVLLLPSSLGFKSIEALNSPALIELATLEGELRKSQACKEVLNVREAVKSLD